MNDFFFWDYQFLKISLLSEVLIILSELISKRLET